MDNDERRDRAAIVDELDSLNNQTSEELIQEAAKINNRIVEDQSRVNKISWLLNTRIKGITIDRKFIEEAAGIRKTYPRGTPLQTIMDALGYCEDHNHEEERKN